MGLRSAVIPKLVMLFVSTSCSDNESIDTNIQSQKPRRREESWNDNKVLGTKQNAFQD